MHSNRSFSITRYVWFQFQLTQYMISFSYYYEHKRDHAYCPKAAVWFFLDSKTTALLILVRFWARNDVYFFIALKKTRKTVPGQVNFLFSLFFLLSHLIKSNFNGQRSPALAVACYDRQNKKGGGRQETPNTNSKTFIVVSSSYFAFADTRKSINKKVFIYV